MPTLTCDISQSLADALTRYQQRTGEPTAHVVMRALADALQVEHATLFQVSTSGALVEGVYQGVVAVGTLKAHGDFGLGTFADLDGEMVALDGRYHQVRASGAVVEAPDAALVPFAVVTHFRPERTVPVPAFDALDALLAALDAVRDSSNLFFAVRARGTFDYVKTRAVCKAETPTTLVEAAAHQAEFEFTAIAGTLVGFWTPEYAKAVNVAGYHLHFLSDDRRHGGHLLACRGLGLQVQVEHTADFRMAIPETPQFLKADLTGDPSQALDRAERDHPRAGDQ
ncbi:MAG TPA: acetolactate decarboxylase [Chloroflexota bacterium]|jgi:acetolactate decarboxylase